MKDFLLEMKHKMAEKGATTLTHRFKIVKRNLEESDYSPDEQAIKKISDFILEPLSPIIKRRMEKEIINGLRGKIGFVELKNKLNVIEKEKKKPVIPSSIDKIITMVREDSIKIEDEEVKKLFINCFPNTIKTATYKMNDGTFYVVTGDVEGMWLRDSSGQIHPYIYLAKNDLDIAEIIKGVVKRQAKCIIKEPYAYAFFEDYEVRRKKFELDSLLYPIWLTWDYWKETGDKTIFIPELKEAFYVIIEVLTREQNHNKNSDYEPLEHFSPNDKDRELITEVNPVKLTGMIWSGFRPSDDPCVYNYNIPSQIFAVVTLKNLAKIFDHIYKDKKISKMCIKLSKEIEEGVTKYGIYNHPKYGRIYAYETDGLGNYELIDDANPPNLMSIPYFDYFKDNKIYQNTRSFILSLDNSYFIEGKFAKGIKSPHRAGIWPLSLIMQAMTSQKLSEFNQVLIYLKNTHAGTYLIHEAFNPDNPNDYSRPWFSWANSLFAELVIKKIIGTRTLSNFKSRP